MLINPWGVKSKKNWFWHFNMLAGNVFNSVQNKKVFLCYRLSDFVLGGPLGSINLEIPIDPRT